VVSFTYKNLSAISLTAIARRKPCLAGRVEASEWKLKFCLPLQSRSPALWTGFFTAGFIFTIFLYAHAGQPPKKSDKEINLEYSNVTAVIDGDTIEIQGGKHVRYIGIDTPEMGEPLYEEARDKNKELVLGKTVRLAICKAEQTDKHGRLLAYVYTGQTMVNIELLRGGYARILTIPPCGVEKAEEFRLYQKEAMEKKTGLWGKKKGAIPRDLISASDAVRFTDERKAIHGQIIGIRKGKKAIFLGMGNDTKVRLRIVIFKQDERNFQDLNINPLTHYLYKEVIIYGKIKIYKNFPEVIIGSPSQIEIRE